MALAEVPAVRASRLAAFVVPLDRVPSSAKSLGKKTNSEAETMRVPRDESEGGDLIVEPTADGRVQLRGGNCSLTLTPEEACLLGRALLDTAEDVDPGME